MKKITKKNRNTFVKISLIVMFSIWFVGWESIRYDNKDVEIGHDVVFTVPMVLVTGIPKSMTGKMIADKYGAMLWLKNSWENSKSNYPNVKTREITCNEVFNAVDVFYFDIHGFLKQAFKGSGAKFYVLSSSNNNKIIILGEIYEYYSKNPNYGRQSQTEHCGSKSSSI